MSRVARYIKRISHSNTLITYRSVGQPICDRICYGSVGTRVGVVQVEVSANNFCEGEGRCDGHIHLEGFWIRVGVRVKGSVSFQGGVCRVW